MAAAVASTCDTVTTPVPPIPVIRIENCPSADDPAGLVRRRHGARIADRLLARDDGEERRAVARQAGEVQVARGLADPGLAAELGRHRLHGQAVGLHAAVAAAFTDPLVDEDPPGGRLRLPAPPLAALFRRALLVVDQHGDAVGGREFLLDGQQVVPVPDRYPVPGLPAEPLRIV